MHIHVYEGITENDLSDFFWNSMGSKYFGGGLGIIAARRAGEGKFDAAYKKISDTPNIWIGEVSWLKAGLFNNEETYVPGPVSIIKDLIGENLPTIDEELIDKIEAALNAKNTTDYSVAKPDEVVGFLLQHKGKKCFTVSW